MAKKERFTLDMADGTQVRDLDALKEHFDIETVAKYFHNGKLRTWLNDRYYDDEATAIENLSADDKDFAKKLCAIFGVESEEEVLRRAERLDKLKQYTDDENILTNIDSVAFDQEELADLLDANIHEIYLCANRFTVPLRVKNKIYIGLGKAVVVIRSNKVVDFAALGIEFKNVTFNAEYANLLPEKNPPKISGNTAEVTTTIINRSGIHDRLAYAFVKKACGFKSEIKLQAKGKAFDAKSIMSLMQLGLFNGMDVTVTAKGDDARRAVTELKNFIDAGFAE